MSVCLTPWMDIFPIVTICVYGCTVQVNIAAGLSVLILEFNIPLSTFPSLNGPLKSLFYKTVNGQKM